MIRKKVLVTGASGFVGTRVCALLSEQGWEVVALTRTNRTLYGVQSRVLGDVRDKEAVARAVKGASAVVHLAGRVHVMDEKSADPAAEYRQVNVEGTANLFTASRVAGVERFIFVSSIKAVAESSANPITEETAPQPVDAYGISKREAELVVLDGGSPMVATVLRLPMVYGPRMKGNMLRLFRLVDRRAPLPFAAVQNRRSMVFIETVADAIEKVLGTGPEASGIFFVADREAISTPDLIRKIARLLGRAPLLVPLPSPVLKALAAAADAVGRPMGLPAFSPSVDRLVDSLIVSPQKLIDRLGFKHRYSLDDGLAAAAQWYREIC